MSLLEQLSKILEEVVWILELPLLLLEDRVKRVTFLSIRGSRVTGLEFIRTIVEDIKVVSIFYTNSPIVEDIRRSCGDIRTSVAFIRKSGGTGDFPLN